LTPLIASLSGLRGIYGDGLTPEVIISYTRAFGSIIGQKIIIGRDSRSSGPEIESLVIKSLISAGCTPIQLGIATTPTTQIAVEKLNADGGIIITASHNTAEWNGLKFLGSDGTFIGKEEFEKIQTKLNSIIDGDDEAPQQEIESYENSDKDHLDLVLSMSHLNIDNIRKRKFKVAIDCVNGAASNLLPELLRSLGCEMTEIYCDTDAEFPHNPEPLEKNLSELIVLTEKSGSDVGFAVDPDGDRLAIVANGGQYISEEYTVVIATEVVLSNMDEGQTVVTNLSTTRALDDIASKYKAELSRTLIGEINVVSGMKEVGAVIGGEGNGGVILPELHYGRDALVGAALALQFMTQHEDPLSRLYTKLPQYVMHKGKVNLGAVSADDALQNLADYFSGEKIDLRDGVKIEKSEGWIHVRKSNTEPIMRIYTEANDAAGAERLAEEAENIIRGAGD